MKYFLTFILIIIPLVLFSHGEEKHKNKVQPVKLAQKITKHLSENKQHPIKDNPNMLRQIDLAYKKGIKPIFEQNVTIATANKLTSLGTLKSLGLNSLLKMI